MATTTEKQKPRRSTASPLDLLPIASWGRREVLAYSVVLGVVAYAASFLSSWLTIPPTLLAIFVLWFFRDPPRRVPAAPGMIVSPADGRVTHVERVVEAEYWHAPAVKVSIYLSLFDVHVNRVPEAARVVEIRTLPGLRLNTWRVHSAKVNAQCCTLFQGAGPSRRRFLVRQVAGPFASRVVCAVRPGEVLERGARFGMIKFGSRTELLICGVSGLHVLVRPGDHVKGGQSVVATYDI
jgi:phosphatidylserine decarboxylase